MSAREVVVQLRPVLTASRGHRGGWRAQVDLSPGVTAMARGNTLRAAASRALHKALGAWSGDRDAEVGHA